MLTLRRRILIEDLPVYERVASQEEMSITVIAERYYPILKEHDFVHEGFLAVEIGGIYGQQFTNFFSNVKEALGVKVTQV